MRSIDNISEELFDKIRSRVANIKLGNSEGEVTTEPGQARFFEFNFKHRDLPVGAVTISINEEDKLQVYFPNSMVEDADSSSADAWYGFLKELSKFSARNMLNYETHNVTKERLDKKDYKFLTQRNQDEVMENRLHGTSQKSFLEQGKAKLIIQHSKTVDETKMGARSRNISAIYIENTDGERFKFANNYLPGARAMARHVSNEGHTRDERGTHIVEIMQEMQQLKQFVRSAKSNNYVTEEAQDVIEAATDRYYGLKDTLKAISNATGYDSYFENWVPDVIEVEEDDINDLKTKLTRQVFDDRMADTLPSVSRALALRAKTKEAKMDKDAETRSDDELDAEVAGRANDVVSLANSSENIQVFKNEADEQELKNYFNVMKNSDMETSKKNRNLVINVIEYISNNHVDDRMAVVLGGIDYDDKAQYEAAIKITKKYLQGKVDTVERAAKKDLYGKEKKEDVTFETYEQGLNMISEGTWALPDDMQTTNEIIRLMQDPIPLGDAGEDATSAIGFAFGDDELFDDLGDAGDTNPQGDARPIIKKWLAGKKDNYDDSYNKFLNMIYDEVTGDEPTTGTGAKGLEKSLDKLYGPKKEEVDQPIEEVDRIKDPEDLNVYDQEEINNMEKSPQELRDTVIGHASHLLDKAADDFTDDDYIADEMGDDFANMHMFADDDTLESYDMLRNVMGEDPGQVAEVAKQVMKALGKPNTEATEEVDEVAESIAKMKAMAGVGSKARSNHGIHEGEQGYQITPRSIVARQMRKLQDIENSK